MPNWKDLLNAESYSEGDPVRQLFGAASAVKDWPVDALAWGADLVDLSSSGLAKILARRPELAKAVKTDLGGNLRRAFAPEGYGRPTMTEGPAPDIEEGRSVGRMLNPLLWVGNQKIPTPTLKQFSPNRREFLTKVAEAHKEAEKAAESDSILNTPMTRRDFNKGMATAAVAAPAAGLLYKFGKGKQALEAAPEIARVAEVAPKAAEGGVYKYNTLKEYIDNVIKEASSQPEKQIERWGGHWNEEESINRSIHARLIDDEDQYEAAKNLYSLRDRPDWGINLPVDEEHIVKAFNEFSPQAKQEMKALKKSVMDMNTGRIPGPENRPIYKHLDWADPENWIHHPNEQALYKELNKFSPQAKKEMKEFKSLTRQIDNDYAGSHDWTKWLTNNSDDPQEIIQGLKRWYVP